MCRFLFFALCLCLGFSDPHISVVACDMSPTNMVGWWPGDGNANDITTNNNYGILQGGATATNTGIVAQCFNFDVLKVSGHAVLKATKKSNFVRQI